MAAPYLTAEQVRQRISVGGPSLEVSEFPDQWVEDMVAEVETRVETECGVAFTPREQVETIRASAPGGSGRLLLKWAQVRSITSFLVDGEEVAPDLYSFDASGWVYYPTGFHPRYPATITYEHGYDEPPPILKRATAIYVERQAIMSRSSSSRDVKVQGIADGGSTVFVRPAPGTWQITGIDEFDEIVASLPNYRRRPGIA